MSSKARTAILKQMKDLKLLYQSTTVSDDQRDYATAYYALYGAVIGVGNEFQMLVALHSSDEDFKKEMENIA